MAGSIDLKEELYGLQVCIFQVLEVPNESFVKNCDGCLWVCSSDTVFRYSCDGVLMDTRVYSGYKVYNIAVSDAVAVSTDKGVLIEPGNLIALNSLTPCISMVWLGPLLLLHQSTGITIIKDCQILSYEAVLPVYANSIPMLNSFICVSSANISIITEKSTTLHLENPFSNSKVMDIHQDTMIFIISTELVLYSLRKFLLIKSWSVTDKVVSVKYGDVGLGKCNLIMGTEADDLVLAHVSAVCYKVLFRTKVYNCGVIGSSLIRVNTKVFGIKEPEASVRVKTLIKELNFKDAAKIAEGLGTGFITSFIKSILADNNSDDPYNEICNFIKHFTNDLDDIATVVYNTLINDPPNTLDIYENCIKIVIKTLSDLKTSSICIKNLKDIENKLKIFLEASPKLYEKVSITHWQEFLSSNSFLEVLTLFKRKEIKLGIKLFSCNINPYLKSKLLEILEAIPLDVQVSVYSSWVQNKIIPILTCKELIDLENFLLARAKEYETHDENPYKAYACTKILTHSIPIALNLGTVQDNKIIMLNFSSIGSEAFEYMPSKNFLSIQRSLQVMGELLNNYHIRISLDMIDKENDKTIGMKILEEESCPEMIPSQIECYLSRYCIDKKIDMDMILRSFLKTKAEKIVYEGYSSWEHAIVKSISYIKDLEIRAEVSLDVLQNAHKPFSKDYSELLESSLSYKSSLDGHFQALKSLQVFKSINTLYTREEINVNDKFQISMFLMFILQSSNKNSIEHTMLAMKILPSFKKYEIYLYYIAGCIAYDEIARIDQLGSWVDNEPDRNVILEVIIEYCIELLNHTDCPSNWFKRRYIVSCNAAIAVINTFGNCLHLKEYLVQIENLLALASQYQVFLSFADYQKKKKRMEVLISFIAVYLEGSYQPRVSLSPRNHRTVAINKINFKPISFTSLSDCSKLLSISSHEFHLRLAIQSCSKKEEYLKTLDYLNQIVNSPIKSKSIKDLIKISVTLMNTIEDHSVPSQLKSIFTSVSLTCPAADLETLNQIVNDLSICEIIYIQACGMSTDNKDFPDSINEDMCINLKDIRPLVRLYFEDRCYGRNTYTRELADKLIEHKGLRTALQLLMNTPSVCRPGEINQILNQIFDNITKSRYIDHEQALNLMFEIRKPELFQSYSYTVLDKFTDYYTIQTLCTLGKDYSIISGLFDTLDDWNMSKSKAKWKKSLNKLGIQGDFIGCTDKDDILDLILNVIERKGKLDLCLELCGAYGIPETEALKLYMKNLIINPEIKPDILACINSTESTLEEIINKDYPFTTEYMNKVREHIYKLDSYDIKTFLTEKCLQKVVQVDYSRIIFILELIYEASSCLKHQLELSKFLSQYKRLNKPSDNESKSLIGSNPYISYESKRIYEIMNKKLISLDTFMEKPQDLLSQELCARNLYDFLKFGHKLNIDHDLMHIIAIENEFKHVHTGKKCSVCPKYSELKSFINSMKRVQNKVEILDKISFYYQCSNEILDIRSAQIGIIKQHKEWIDRNGAKTLDYESIVRELQFYERKKVVDQTRLELLKFNIDEDFGLYFDKPYELIKNIYTALIPEAFKEKSGRSAEELYELTKNICEYNNLELKEVHTKLFKEWVVQDPSVHLSHEEICMRPAYCFTKSLYLGGSVTTKLLFLVKFMEKQSCVRVLLEIIKDSGYTSYFARARALSMLSKIDKTALEKVQVKWDIKEYTQSCWYMADFDLLKIPINIDQLLDSSSKNILCNLLYSKYHQEIRTLQVISCIVIDYKVVDKALYSNVLASLLALQDYYAVLLILDQIVQNGVYSTVLCPDFIKFTGNALIKIAEFMSNTQEDTYLEVFYTCCVEASIEYEYMKEIIKKMLGCNKKEFIRTALDLAELLGSIAVAGIIAYYYVYGLETLLKFLRDEKRWNFNYFNPEEFILSVLDNPCILKHLINILPKAKIAEITSILKSRGKTHLITLIETSFD